MFVTFIAVVTFTEARYVFYDTCWSVTGPGAPATPEEGGQGMLPPSRLRLSMLLLLMHRGKLGAGLEI